MVLTQQNVDLRSLVDRSVDSSSRRAPGRPFEVRVQGEPPRVTVDPDRIAQVLDNLLPTPSSTAPPGRRLSSTIDATRPRDRRRRHQRRRWRRPRGAAAPLQPLLSRRRRQAREGRGSGALHRARARRGPRRPHGRREPAGSDDDVSIHAAARDRSPARLRGFCRQRRPRPPERSRGGPSRRSRPPPPLGCGGPASRACWMRSRARSPSSPSGKGRSSRRREADLAVAIDAERPSPRPRRLPSSRRSTRLDARRAPSPRRGGGRRCPGGSRRTRRSR